MRIFPLYRVLICSSKKLSNTPRISANSFGTLWGSRSPCTSRLSMSCRYRVGIWDRSCPLYRALWSHCVLVVGGRGSASQFWLCGVDTVLGRQRGPFATFSVASVAGGAPGPLCLLISPPPSPLLGPELFYVTLPMPLDKTGESLGGALSRCGKCYPVDCLGAVEDPVVRVRLWEHRLTRRVKGSWV